MKKKNRIYLTDFSKNIDRFTIRISGSGGQGIVSTGAILAEAIAIGDDKNVSLTLSYGPEARGGSANSDIIVSDGEIYFPECNRLDLLVSLTYEAYENYAPDTNHEGLIVADETAVDVLVGTAKTVKVPFIKSAKEIFDSPIMANMITLGFLSSYVKIVTKDSLNETVSDHFFGSEHLKTSMNAIEVGLKLGNEYCKIDDTES